MDTDMDTDLDRYYVDRYGIMTLCAAMTMLANAVMDIAATHDKVTAAELYRLVQASLPRIYVGIATHLLDEVFGILESKYDERYPVWPMPVAVTRDGSMTQEDLMRIVDILRTMRAIRGCP
jgi:hypothetical protein